MHLSAKHLNSVLVKPAGPDCNMVCTYCFYLKKANLFPDARIHRMTEVILEETIRQMMTQSGEQVSFGWQGGEPTLMGLPFFENVVEFQKRYGHGQSTGNGLQTNGILINKNWAKFLRDYKFLIGLSIDGPEHIHNRYRFMRNGQGSWSRVVDRAKLLLDAEVAVNALIVVNNYSVRFPQEIYEFHKNLGLKYMQFIPCMELEPKDPTRAAPFSAPSKEYGKFLCKLFDLWLADFINDKPTTSVRFFDSVFFQYVDMEPPECTLLPACGVYVVVEHNGDVYSCDFYVEPEWKLGNIMEGNLTEMLNSDLQYSFGLMKATLPTACKNCRWLRYCRGGCTKNRIRNPQEGSINKFCKSYKMFFEHADSSLRDLAQKWKRQQILEEQKTISQNTEERRIKVGRNEPCPCGSGLKFKKCCGK